MDVLIYSGQGASQQGINFLQAGLRHLLCDAYAVRLVSAKTLREEPWEKSTALLVLPGGRDLPYVADLKGAGTDRIKAYVQAGGRYFGVCAGAYFASKELEFELGTPLEVKGARELCFFEGLCQGAAFPGFIYDSEEGARDVQLTFKDGVRATVYWNGGGFFADAEETEAQIIARYDDLPATPAAIVLCRYGQGLALLSGVHPEHPRSDQSYCWNDVFRNLLELLELQVLPVNDASSIEPTPQFLYCANSETQSALANSIMRSLNLKINQTYQDQADSFALLSLRDSASLPSNVNRIILDCPLTEHKTIFDPQTYFACNPSALMGCALLVADVVTSTQSLLDKNPKLLEALPEGIVSVAGRQTLGRGRGGNAWVSPTGSLMFSLVLKVPGAMASSLVFLQYLFALAVVEALQPHVKLCLKWPNDIYADLGTNDINRYRKVGGVLVNTLYAKGQFQAVIGCGLNVENQRPTLSLNQLAFLQNPGAEHFGLETTLALIWNCFDQMWDQFRQQQSFAPFLDRYLGSWIHSGQQVKIEATNQSAVIEGITLNYGLLRTRVTEGPDKGTVLDLQPDGNSFDMYVTSRQWSIS